MDVLEPLTRFVGEEENVEAQSTEELLRCIQKANVTLKEVDPGEVAVGSMDVTALYPRLDQNVSARMAKEAYLSSDFEVEGVDWKAVSL